MVLVSIWNQEFMSVEHTKETSNSEVILPEPDHDLLCIARVLQKDSDSPQSGYTFQPTQKMTQKRKDGNWETVRVPFHSSHIEISSGVQIADINEAFEALRDRVTDIISNPRPVHETITYGYPTSEAQTSKLIPRIKSNFSTSPQHLHYLDIDSIIAPAKLRGRHLSELAGWLNREIFPDWLRDSTYIIQATGSHGCISKCGKQDVPRLRIILWLKERVTPEEFKVIAQAINTDMKSRGVDYIGGDPLDTTIYTRERMLFFAPPVINSEGVPYTHDRLVLVEGDYDEVRIPEELIKRDSSNVVQLPIGGGYSASKYARLELEDLLEKMQSDGSHGPILAMMARFARKYPNQQERHAAIQEFLPRLEAKLREFSEDEENYQRRLDEEIGADGNKLFKSADDYAAKINKTPVIISAKPEMKNEEVSYTIEKFRSEFPDELDRLIKKLLVPGDKSISPVIEFKIPPGGGKSYAANKSLTANEILNKKRIFYLNSTHEQSDERHSEALNFLSQKDGADVNSDARLRVWKGRRHLCLVTGTMVDKQARTLEQAGLSPMSVCKNCSHYHECPWIIQREDQETGLIFAQHANLTSTLANMDVDFIGAPDLLAIDEGYWQSFIDSKLSCFQLRDIRKEVSCSYEGTDLKRKHEEEQLQKYREMLHGVLEESNDTISSESIQKFGETSLLTQRHIDSAASYENIHQRKLTEKIEGLQKKLLESQTKEDNHYLNEFLREFRISDFVQKIYLSIKASLEITGRNRVMGVRIVSKYGMKFVECCIRKPVPEIFSDVPVILLNASANKNITEAVLGSHKSALKFSDYKIKISPDQYHLTQIVDRPFGKAMFSKGDLDNPQGHSNIARLRRDIFVYSAKWRGIRKHNCIVDEKQIDVLVICQSEVRQRLEALGLPDNVDVRNFPVEGLNGYKDVPCLVVIGRRSPPAHIVERQAEALNYDNPDFIDVTSTDKYEYGRHLVQLVDGRRCEISCERHPDPFVDAIRSSIADEGVIQAIHRARIFDRKPENYCDIFVYGTTDTGLPVHNVTTWNERNYSLYDLSVANGIIFSSRNTIIRAYGDAYVNELSSVFSGYCKSMKRIVMEKIPLSFQVSNNKYIIGTRNNKADFRAAQFRLETIGLSRKAKIQYAYVSVSRYGRRDIDIQKVIASIVNHGRLRGHPKFNCIDFEWMDIETKKRKRGQPKK